VYTPSTLFGSNDAVKKRKKLESILSYLVISWNVDRWMERIIAGSCGGISWAVKEIEKIKKISNHFRAEGSSLWRPSILPQPITTTAQLKQVASLFATMFLYTEGARVS